LTGLSVLALALSGFLGWHYLMGGSMIGCGGGSPCDQVLSSRWSAIGGVVPVSGLAEGAYLAILAASFFIGSTAAAPVRRLAWRAMLILAGAITGSAVWFIIVQKWIVGAFCPYCMATHITGLLLAALVIWRAPREFENDLTNSARIVSRLPAIGFTVTGLLLAGILAICQVVIIPPAIYRGGEAQEKLPTLDPHAVPLVGSPGAPFVVTLFFDYNCPHCQQVHSMLDEAIRRFDGKVAFVLCPAPLNTKCNPYVPRDVDEFKDSCELTKIALAVWVAKRDAFPVFDRWMFSPEPGDIWRPRSLDAARAKAIELVGQAKFSAAQADPWIDQYLQTSIQIYGHTSRSGNAVPKLVFGSRWVIPQPNNADDLVSILRDSLGVPAPKS
jgi:uncharacterized membrane protein/protein-disulfide isomerase